MFTILLVEDNRLFCKSFRAFLLGRFSDVIIAEAPDSIDAMQKIDAQTFDLVFMDIKLPGVNGLYLSKIIKERYPELPIIILSSYDLAEYREAALGLSAEEYMVKQPWTADISKSWSNTSLLVKRLLPAKHRQQRKVLIE
jgi:YesN/AraC family two-component response regulator